MTATNTPAPSTKPARSAKPATKPSTRTVKAATTKTAAKASSTVKKSAVAKSALKTQAPAKSASPKSAKEKKIKMVRDSFAMPKTEFAVIDTMKLRAAKLAQPVKKTELLRAGIKALAAMPDAAFLAAVQAIPNLKTGRPTKAEVSAQI